VPRRPRKNDNDGVPVPGLVTAAAPDAPDHGHLVSVLGSNSKIRVSGPRDHRIGLIAQHQRGRVSRSQLPAAVVSADMIYRLLRRPYLFRLHAGVYAVGHLAPTPLGRETAALLAGPAGAALSHLTAAILWGLLDPAADDGAVHVLVGRHARGRRDGIQFHSSRRVEAGDIRIRERPARRRTGPGRRRDRRDGSHSNARTGHRSGRGPADPHPSRASPSHGPLPGSDRAAARQSGAGPARPDDHDPLRGRRTFLELIRVADLPRPQVNARLHGCEVDCLWPERNLVVEIDGFQFHGPGGRSNTTARRTPSSRRPESW
jgi:hypothetical protein